MPNLYKSELLKKYVSNERDLLYERTGIHKNSRILITGMSGGGKTSCLLQFIIESGGFFDHIFLTYKTSEPIYQMLEDKMIDKKDPSLSSLSVYNSLSDFPHVEQFLDAVKMKKGHQEHYLCVFDDCVNDTKQNKDLYFKLEKYFKFGRKKNLTLVFLTQSYFDVETFYRKQLNYLIITKLSNDTDFKRMVREYGSFLSAKELFQIYLDMHENLGNDLPFMLIDLNSKSKNKYISINFNNYLEFVN